MVCEQICARVDVMQRRFRGRGGREGGEEVEDGDGDGELLLK